MKLTKEDQERLKKIGVSNLLDLALIVPTRYENLYISKTPKIGVINVLDVTIKSTSYNPKFMKLTLIAHNLDKELNGIIFHPRKYHSDTFKSGQRFFVLGKLEFNYGELQIVQPQLVAEINRIEPKYKTSLQNKTVIRLIKAQITQDALEDAGVSSQMAEMLYAIHNPTVQFLEQFESHEGYTPDQIYMLKYLEIYNHIQKLSAKKVDHPAKRKLLGSLDDFIKNLPFQLTGDQQKVIAEIRNDFLGDTAAKRVIMGDVGCGKTMVILASVMMAYPSKSILMAPTTVLAKQIYEEALKFLPKTLNIGLVTNQSDKKESLLAYDFLVGTHALLYRELPDADLVMVDEQHRFGTKQRTLISKLVAAEEKHPHFLQFSATPIPRTLSMMQASIIDISQIKELPFPKDIETHIVGPRDFSDLTEHIRVEIEEGRQTIVVYPLVAESEVIEYQSIDEAKAWWQKNFKKVYVTHGKDKEKEDVINAFKEEGNILIATTLIEVGISLPNLSTIVIVAPERLGLASLHQLRGRVSRTGLKGYCYLFTKQKASERLASFSNTLDGFEIAELDLKFRQAGDLLKGDIQSGKSFRWFDPKEDEAILKSVKSAIAP
ncbi:MAG: ATP-dependent DNA helicase RecG [Epsilonproteobacteria bacterium]|nr:ATP-dependent DNA helicase RecG [Campylobacterota bacterium]